MLLGRALLWGIGLMSVAFGMAYLVSPVSMLELTGGSALTPAATTDVRATYGGLQLGLGAFLLWSALAPERIPSALLAHSVMHSITECSYSLFANRSQLPSSPIKTLKWRRSASIQTQ